MKRWALILTSVVFSMGCNVLDDNPKIGSRDCAVLDEGGAGQCELCQGQPCDPVEAQTFDADGDGVIEDCYHLPCIDGSTVVEGCDSDSQCAHMSTPETKIWCGMGNSYHGGFCGTDPGNM